MKIVGFVLLFISMLGAPAGAAAQTARIEVPPALALAEAMDAIRAGDWATADERGTAAGPLGAAVVEWHRLRAGRGTFDEALDFLERHGDWPGLPLLKARMERELPLSGRSSDVLFFFGEDKPTTGRGTRALVTAYSETGATGDAEATAVEAWLTLPLGAEAEAQLMADHEEILAPLQVARLDMLLWQGNATAARRALVRVDDATGGWAALTEARLALRTEAAGVDDLIEAVPETHADDPGLAYDRFRWRLSRGLREEAIELLIERSISADAIGRADVWASARRDLARWAMRQGDHETAYAIAAPHHLTEGAGFADLEWLSGYLALRFLDAPDKALEHFRRFRGAVETPISLGRAGYWLGRTHEALGDTAAAADAYSAGAEHQTSFYGLLSAERLGVTLDPSLAGGEEFPDISQARFRRSTVFEAALLLHAAGERPLARRFMVHLGESLTREELGTMANFTLGLGEPNIALAIAKFAAQRGWVIIDAYFPVVDFGLESYPVPEELALAVARRESEFAPGVASGVGARGLMQLMPATAREVAGDLGLDFSPERLFTDPTFNATLGTAYLAGLADRFGPSPVLIAAGYNAGPSRPARWIEEHGDPRTGAVDVIDWIEHIPFDETRNYVMRVAESLPVYRARLRTADEGLLDFTGELRGRD